MRLLQYSKKDYANMLPHPKRDANKFTRGSAAIIAGSARFPGAATLATAAARCGSGYTVLVTPQAAAASAHAHLASIPVCAVPQHNGCFCLDSLSDVNEACTRAQALVIGPGIGRGLEVAQFLREFLAKESRPLVLDADAITLLAKDPSILDARKANGIINVLTPHVGEAARLLGREVSSKIEGAVQDAIVIAKRFHAIVALKGAQTVIASYNEDYVIFSDGGPELAKAGSGDVLCGMVGAMLAQQSAAQAAALTPLNAVCLAVYVHAYAAKLAAAKITDIAVMPEDVISNIGDAFFQIDSFGRRESPTKQVL